MNNSSYDHYMKSLRKFTVGTCPDLSTVFNGTYGYSADFEYQWRILKNSEAFTLNGKKYRPIKSVQGKSLEAGMKLLAKYNSTNCGVDFIEIIGITNCNVQYGEYRNISDIKKTVKDMMLDYSAKTLEELRDKQHEYVITSGISKDSYGWDSHLVVKDLDTKDIGAWYYIFENKWCRGSGAEALSFILVEEVIPTKEELDKIDEDKAENAARILMTAGVLSNFMNVN